MTDCTLGRDVMLAAQIFALCALAACGRTDTGPDGAEQAAAVENVEAMAAACSAPSERSRPSVLRMQKLMTRSSTGISPFLQT